MFNIQAGDILMFHVTPQDPFLDRAIGSAQLMLKVGTGTTLYRHTSLAVIPKDNVQVEATWPKVRSSQYDPNNPQMEIWRVIGATDDQVAKAIAAARSRIGEWYDVGEFCFGLFRSKHMEICSRLINDVWFAAGVVIVPGNRPCVYPNDLVASGRIRRVA